MNPRELLRDVQRLLMWARTGQLEPGDAPEVARIAEDVIDLMMWGFENGAFDALEAREDRKDGEQWES